MVVAMDERNTGPGFQVRGHLRNEAAFTLEFFHQGKLIGNDDLDFFRTNHRTEVHTQGGIFVDAGIGIPAFRNEKTGAGIAIKQVAVPQPAPDKSALVKKRIARGLHCGNLGRTGTLDRTRFQCVAIGCETSGFI
jgi:hypothetical protein